MKIDNNVSNVANVANIAQVEVIVRNIATYLGTDSDFRELINASHVSRLWQHIHLGEVAKRLGFQNFDEVAKCLGVESWEEFEDTKNLKTPFMNFRSKEDVFWFIKDIANKQRGSQDIKKTLLLLKAKPGEITLDRLRDAGIVPKEETQMDPQVLAWFDNKANLLACIRYIPKRDVQYIPYILHQYLSSLQLDVCVAMLKEKGLDLKINEKDQSGHGVLHCFIHALSWSRDRSAHPAYIENGLKIIEALVKQGLHIDAPIDNDSQWTALHLAAFYGQFEIVNGLLGAGATPCVTDKALETPLHLTVVAGNSSHHVAPILDIINCLCDKDKDIINARNAVGETALDKIEQNDSRIANLLKERGAYYGHEVNDADQFPANNSNIAIAIRPYQNLPTGGHNLYFKA